MVYMVCYELLFHKLVRNSWEYHHLYYLEHVDMLVFVVKFLEKMVHLLNHLVLVHGRLDLSSSAIICKGILSCYYLEHVDMMVFPLAFH